MQGPIDVFIGCFSRPKYTEQTLKYFIERTNYPYRLFLLINGEDEGNNFVARTMFKDNIFMIVNFSKNGGTHMLWNVALSLAESEYFITSDNDVLVPDLHATEWVEKNEKIIQLNVNNGVAPCWLERIVKFMDKRPDYGAISLHPHVFIGIKGEDPNDPEDVKEAPMAGAVFRIMRRETTWKAGGWEKKIEAGRDNEERVICSRLQSLGYKVGRTTRIRAWHEFGKNWGYDESFTPEMQKHNPDLEPYVNQFNNKDLYNKDTWMPL